MTHLEEYIQGTCQQMCPEEEIILREREGLIHKLEMLKGTENQTKPKPDKSKMVKSFSRSAAGVKLNIAKNLRPPPVLRQTVAYLLHDVVTVPNFTWNVIYDFVMDRLRAVRQDMVIQNLTAADYISLLQPMIRFYAYASYRLCEANRDIFDPVINRKHVGECLKRLLTLYDECDRLQKRLDGANVNFNFEHFDDDRPYFEALYVLLNLGDPVAITRAVELPKKWRGAPIVGISLIMSRAFRSGNWVQTCKLFEFLPALHCAIASLHLPVIRRNALKVMTIAYSSKNLKFPAEHLKILLLYHSLDDLFLDCKYFGVNCDEKEKMIHFLKGNFCDNQANVPPRQEDFVNKKLEKYEIPFLLLENAS